eukprot:tig00000158_g10128.t1
MRSLGPILLRGAASLSTEAISSIATAGLSMILKHQDGVSVRIVSSNFLSLLSGHVDEVEVEGRGWETPRGLSCRSIHVKTEALQLDLPAVLSGRIVLASEARATARLVVGDQDFNSFLVSPVFRSSLSKLKMDGRPLLGLRARGIRRGVLELAADYDGVEHCFDVVAGPGGKAVVSGGNVPEGATAAGDPSTDAALAARLAKALEDFLNGVVLDLNGLLVRLEAFSIHDGRLEISGSGKVWKFPTGLLAF